MVTKSVQGNGEVAKFLVTAGGRSGFVLWPECVIFKIIIEDIWGRT
jgi:hypothetical protein